MINEGIKKNYNLFYNNFYIFTILLIVLHNKGKTGCIEDIVIDFFSSSIMTIFIDTISYKSK